MLHFIFISFVFHKICYAKFKFVLNKIFSKLYLINKQGIYLNDQTSTDKILPSVNIKVILKTVHANVCRLQWPIDKLFKPNINSDCNWTRILNHLARKRTLNHLAKLAKWLNCVLSTYLYSAFDCMFLSCHVRVSEWIHTL